MTLHILCSRGTKRGAGAGLALTGVTGVTNVPDLKRALLLQRIPENFVKTHLGVNGTASKQGHQRNLKRVVPNIVMTIKETR